MPTPEGIATPFKQVAFHHQPTMRNKRVTKLIVSEN